MIKTITDVVNQENVKKTVELFKQRNIILPTFEEMRNPQLIDGKIKDKLKNIGLRENNPLNLFRITWKNEPKETGGGYGGVNYIELPRELTGVKAKIVVLTGKWFPTGAHKVGAAYGCLVPRLLTGTFDPTYHKAVWPSTGNYCRGGAFDSILMGCKAIAILPKEMSQERFDWLEEIGSEIIATPGCESNVKEIYDKCNELRETRDDVVILNQFDEFGNCAWHYQVTGPAFAEVYDKVKTPTSRAAAFISATGSAGTIAAGDYLKTLHPFMKVVASEALQCPTLLQNGFGGHRIEGIGDKHIPWIHNVRNTDLVAAIDDNHCMSLLRLFNEEKGHQFLSSQNIKNIKKLKDIGISGIANILAAIKTAKYFEMNEDDIIMTVATDSAEMYQSRLQELEKQEKQFTQANAETAFYAYLQEQSIANLKELTYTERKAIHNLKYFTWVEQQGKKIEDLNQLWDDRELWPKLFNQPLHWDNLIRDFNKQTGLQ